MITQSEVESLPRAASARARVTPFLIFVAAVSLCFFKPLASLCKYSLHDEFFSYIPLIPVISIYLIWQDKAKIPARSGRCIRGTIGAGLAGVAILAACLAAMHGGWRPQLENYLTVMTTSYLMFIVAGGFFFFGSAIMRILLFPIVFLVFMIPMPSGMLDWTMAFFQQTSAVTASAFLGVTGMPVHREGLQLGLPGFSLIVAPECSGIHSTMVLLITAALAGHMFLRSRVSQIALILFVIPLAILRNGFRIFVIGELCVKISPDMINSWIHRKGGPVFFALSLIPFFLVLYWLRSKEHPKVRQG